MRAAICLLVLLLAPDGAGDPFFKFPKETVWTYAMTGGDNGKDARMLMTVTGENDGAVSVSMETRGGPGKSSKMEWFVADGLFFWAERRGEKLIDQIALHKPGSKKGDTWTVEGKEKSPKQAGTNLGTESVQVAAGTYENAVHTRVEFLDAQTKMKIDVYLVEKVGVVKMTYSLDEPRMAFELQEFKPGK
ncbi:MAG TPA: hypothetical protein VE981_07020 [Planctomycetota bacterium]|nr:hypothetical protein [Planctomycetota bacterium]